MLTSESTKEGFKLVRKLPHVRTPDGAVAPRVMALAAGFLATRGYDFSESSLVTYVQAFQQSTVLKLVELWALVPALKLVLLEEIAARGSKVAADPWAVPTGPGFVCAACAILARPRGKKFWNRWFCSIAFCARTPPAPTLAWILRAAICIAPRSQTSPNTPICPREKLLPRRWLWRGPRTRSHTPARGSAARHGHVGYYILAEGSTALHERVGFQPPLGQRIASFLRRHPNEFYLPGTEVLTLAIMSAIVLLLTNTYTSPGLIFLSMLMLLLPCSQSAIQLVNYLITSLLEPQILPKLDFSEGVPDNCTTLVAIPSLLLSQEQVRRLAEDLEVRFLGNHDPNIHFALLTDLPDTSGAILRG